MKNRCCGSFLCGMALGVGAGGIAGILCGCKRTRLARCVCRKAKKAELLLHNML